MFKFIINGIMTATPGGVKHEFECQAAADTVDEALSNFQKVFDPEWYAVRKITALENKLSD